MINIRTERLISLADAAKLMPRRREGRSVARATLLRWHTHGSDGIRLEAVRLPGGHATSVEALQRFLNRLSGVCDDGTCGSEGSAAVGGSDAGAREPAFQRVSDGSPRDDVLGGMVAA